MELQEIFDVALSALVKMLVIVIPILAAILTRAILQFLKQKEEQMKHHGKHDELALLKRFAGIAISAAEQMYDTNGMKFNYAAEQLVRLAATAQIPLSHANAQLLIEGSVKAVKEQVMQYDILEVDVDEIEDKIENGEINIFKPNIN